MADHLPEFFSEWHQQAYAEALLREQEGYKRRMAELEAVGVGEGQPVWDQAKSGLDAALAEHDRVTGKPKAKKAKAEPEAEEK